MSKLPYLNEMLGGPTSDTVQEVEVSVPYFAPDAVANFKRIVGTDSAWSPDGKKIVRRVKSNDSGGTLERSVKSSDLSGALEWIDLDSGKTQLVCADGVSPVWAMTPSENIYFTRVPVGVSTTPFNRSTLSIWQCDPDGQNLTRLTDGYSPSFLKDGSLLVRVQKPDPEIQVIKGFRVNQNSQWVASGFELELKELNAQLSPDGKLVAESGKDFTIRDVATKTALHTLNLSSRLLGKASFAWSPDSRYIAYWSGTMPTPGPWILDVQTGESRLLADLDVSKVRWSHDGRFIAADERGKNQIVILDVSSLHLENGLGTMTQQSP